MKKAGAGVLIVLFATFLGLGARRIITLVRGPSPVDMLDISDVEFHAELRRAGFDNPREASNVFRPLAWSQPVRSERDVEALLSALDLRVAALAAGPHADLISAQSRVHFRATFVDSIAEFSNETTDVWILRQRNMEKRSPGEELPWRLYAIVQDRTSDPPLAFYVEIRPDELKFRGATCYVCHASGPRALRPLRSDLIVGQSTATAFNARIAQNAYVATHFPAAEPRPNEGEPFTASACVECHQRGADRGPLYRVHDESIRALVETGEMPRHRLLTRQQAAEIDDWLKR